MNYSPEFEKIDSDYLNVIEDVVKKLYINKQFLLDNGNKSKITKINGFKGAVYNWSSMLDGKPRRDKFEKKIVEILEFLEDIKNDKDFNSNFLNLIEESIEIVSSLKVIMILTDS